MIDPLELAREFEQIYGRRPRIYRAPGRVNLIGEHTDYNDGFALAMALDRSTWVAAAARADRRLVVRSRAYADTATTDLGVRPSTPADRWMEYVRGVATTLDSGGADLLIASDVPIGAGVSSSAALEIACGYAVLDLAGRPVDRAALARAAQRAEHEFVGTRCGLLDHLTACYGRSGHALLLDFRSLGHRHVSMPASIRVVVANTMVRHELGSGEYNARRADCEEGVAILARRWPTVRALRDVTVADLEAARGDLSDRMYRRCCHVVTENARTLEACEALASQNFGVFGRLMRESHESLARGYEVSCPELDVMAAAANQLDGVYGARMMGGGFGGSVVALVEAGAAERVRDDLQRHYASAIGVEPDVWICRAGQAVDQLNDRLPAPAV